MVSVPSWVYEGANSSKWTSVSEPHDFRAQSSHLSNELLNEIGAGVGAQSINHLHCKYEDLSLNS